MPTYEYQCTKCNHAFEVFQSISDKRLSKCPECKGKVKRLIGRGAGFLFKGSGFYQTDYRSDSYKTKAKEESASSSSSATPSVATPTPVAETKPTATTTTKTTADTAAKPKTETKKRAQKD